MSKARDIADLDFNSPDIDGGNIDGATIGATTPAAGIFSSLGVNPYIDYGTSGNRGKVGYDSNNLYIGSTSSTGSIIFKNNIGSGDAPHSSGDTKMIIGDSGIAFGGTDTGSYGKFTFYQTSQSNGGGISVIDSGLAKTGRLWTDGSNVYLSSGATGTTNLVLNEGGGKIGIGQDTPLAKLDIKGNTQTFAGMSKIYLTDSSSNADSRNWSIGNGGSAYGNFTIGVSNVKDGDPQSSGTHFNPLVITKTGTVIINDSHRSDADFRVESDTRDHMLFVNAGTDTVNVGNSVGKQSIANLNARENGAAIEFGHQNNSSGYYGTLGAFGNNGHPYLGFSTYSEASANTFTTNGFKGNVIEGTATGDLVFSQVTTASATGQTPVNRMRINSAGIVTKPYQPAFQVRLTTQQDNIAVGTTGVSILFNNEVFDQNSDFNTSTYVFTAPVTGRYAFDCNALLLNVDTASNYYQLQLITSNRTYYNTIDPRYFSGDLTYWALNLSCLADMDANDTAYVKIVQASGTSQTDLNLTTTFLSGYLVA